MIFRIEELKRVCTDILYAVDNQSTFDNENVEINVKDKQMYLYVTNSEYFVTLALPVDVEEEFNATVNATLFLKLISQISTDTVEITLKEKYLHIKGNGTYKIPLIYIDEEMLHLSPIEIDNNTVINEGKISGEILNSILNYNSKELVKGVIAKPVQKLYYIDNEGAITFTTGACVNNFHIDTPFSMLLSPKIVRLFKLFKNDEEVEFKISKVTSMGSVDVMGVRFESGNTQITAILPDSSMIASVPVNPIRTMAGEAKDFSIVVNRKNLSDALNRLMLFSASDNGAFGKFTFDNSKVSMKLKNSSASEDVYYEKEMPSEVDCKYEMMLNLKDLKPTIDNFTDMYITVRFGDHKSLVVSRGNIHNILPECIEV